MGIRTASPLPSRRLPAPCLVGGVRRHQSVRQMGSTELPVYLEGGRGTLRAVSAAEKNAEARHEDLVRSAELPVLSLDHGFVRPRSRSPRDRPSSMSARRTDSAPKPSWCATREISPASFPVSAARWSTRRTACSFCAAVSRRDDGPFARALLVPLSGLCCHGSSFHPRRGPPGEPVGVSITLQCFLVFESLDLVTSFRLPSRDGRR